MDRRRIIWLLRISWTAACAPVFVLLVVWSVEDYHDIGIVAFVPYSPLILWCIILAALPWAREIGRFSLRILRIAGVTTKRHYWCVAVSAPSSAATLLMIYVWFHSYYWNNTIQGVIGNQRLQFTSGHGVLSLLVFPERDSPNFPDRSWIHQRFGALNEPETSWKFGQMVPRGIKVAVPHWFTAAFFGSLAAIPWLGLLLLPHRFSLRTLLIAVTLLAVILGFLSAKI